MNYHTAIMAITKAIASGQYQSIGKAAFAGLYSVDGQAALHLRDSYADPYKDDIRLPAFFIAVHDYYKDQA
jgi:hypothetical protein